MASPHGHRSLPGTYILNQTLDPARNDASGGSSSISTPFSKGIDMTAHLTIEDLTRLRNEFNVVRAGAIDAYARVERSLVYLLTTILEVDIKYTSLIVSKITVARFRNKVVHDILDDKTENRYEKFTKSAFKIVDKLDATRNKVVHWHMHQNAMDNPDIDEENLYMLIPLGDAFADSPRLYRSNITDFFRKANFLALELMTFDHFLIGMAEDLPQPWRDRFSQRIIYPPPAGHPQHETYARYDIAAPAAQP